MDIVDVGFDFYGLRRIIIIRKYYIVMERFIYEKEYSFEYLIWELIRFRMLIIYFIRRF